MNHREKDSHKQGIFRENALAKFNQVDAIYFKLKVINSNGWMWLIAFLLGLTGLVIWGFWGKVSKVVLAKGIVIPESSQVIAVQSEKAGNVLTIKVKEGEKVREKTVLATLSNPYYKEVLDYYGKLNHYHARWYQTFKIQYRRQKQAIKAQYFKKRTLLSQNRQNHRLTWLALKDLLKSKQQLFQKHFISKVSVEQTQAEVAKEKEMMANLKIALNNASIEYQNAITRLEDKKKGYLKKYLDSQHQLSLEKMRQKRGSKIMSPVNGIVKSINIIKGAQLHAGQVAFTLVTHNHDDGLNVLAFVNQVEGKTIEKGMKVYVLPQMLSPFQYGYIMAEVESVSQYPLTKSALFTYLGNHALVDAYFRSDPPFLVKIDFLKKQQNKNDYAWTSKKDVPFQLQPGTPVSVKIKREACSPIELLTTCRHGN